MSVTQLRPPPMVAELAALASAFETVAEVPVGALERDSLGGLLTELTVLESRIAALKLEVLAEADRRRLAEDDASTGTDAWAAKLTGSTRAVMSGGLWLVRMLRTRYPATRQAFAAGQINQAQVRIIVRAGEKIPDLATDAQRATAEEALVAKAAAGMNPRRLRQAARRMLDVINTQLADLHEQKQLQDEEDTAETECWLSLSDNGDGTFSGRFTIPELHGHLLRNYLEKLTAPNRLGRNHAGDPVTDDTLPGMGPTLSWTERLGSGFCELLEHLPTQGFGPTGATLLVTIDLGHLHDGLGAAGLDTGAKISAGQARRLACNAGLVPVVLGTRSEPLDLGREARLHNTAQRRTLPAPPHLRHRGLRTPLRLVRHPPPPRLEPRRHHRPRQRPPPLRPPPPTRPRPPLPDHHPPQRRSPIPQTHIDRPVPSPQRQQPGS